MRIPIILTIVFGVAAVLVGQGLPASQNTPGKTIPPKGVAVADADRTALRTSLTRLNAKLDALKANPRLPDVQIFTKAVAYAFDGDEFFTAEEVFRAKELLKIANDRADALLRGDAPWTRTPGLTAMGYVSKIDGSVQPYGLVLPPTYAPDRAHNWRVDVWFHGRSETLSEVNFLWDRLRNPGEFQPRDTIVLHVYGRYCNASKFAGEVDTFEALDDVKKVFRVDENRIFDRGFSMGGASAWHIGAHYGTYFAAVAPGAGFAETTEYAGLAKKGITLNWFEEKLLHLTNATDYAANFFNVPVVAYNGDQDPQAQAADIMARNMSAEGLTLARVIGEKIGHAYTPAARVELDRRMDAIAVRGRDAWPREVRFTTWTLKYNRMRWVVVDALEKHWERARVNATVTNDHAVQATTSNVSAFTLDMGTGASLLSPAAKVSVSIDGQNLDAPGPLTDGSWTVHLRKVVGKWSIGADDAGALRKRHDLQGPIDDAFMDSFIMVNPTGKAMNETVGNWVKSEEAHAIRLWRTQMRGDARVKDDSAITDADIASSNLVLWGDPSSNKVLARIAEKLPIRWTPDGVALGSRRFAAATSALIMIFPNPLNPKKYVVLNSGNTFREYAQTTNSFQVAYLPDYAVVDLTTPPDSRWPGKIAAAGFFGEGWELLANDGR